MFLRRALSVTPRRNLPVSKRQKNCKIVIYIHKNQFAAQTSDLLEKLALLFLYKVRKTARVSANTVC